MQVRLPDLSKGTDSAVITLWHVNEKERVKKGADLVEVSLDKATFDIPAPCSGVLVKKIKKEGDKVRKGELIGEIKSIRRGARYARS